MNKKMIKSFRKVITLILSVSIIVINVMPVFAKSVEYPTESISVMTDNAVSYGNSEISFNGQITENILNDTGYKDTYVADIEDISNIDPSPSTLLEYDNSLETDSDTVLIQKNNDLFEDSVENDIFPDSRGTAGIQNNGLGGIYIDIYKDPFTTFAEKWGMDAYGSNGCGWFASARAKQITKNNNICTWNQTGWYKAGGGAEKCGFSKGTQIKAPSLVCWNGHIAVLEKIENETYYFSEGGATPAPNNDYTRIIKKGKSEINDYLYKNPGKNGSFMGFVYLSPATQSPNGGIDSIGASNGKLYVGGWALDPDSPTTSIKVNVYVEGIKDPIASFKTHLHRDIAGGTDCGFDETIDISDLNLNGKKTVSLWAIDATGDDNAEIGSEDVNFGDGCELSEGKETPKKGNYVFVSALSLNNKNKIRKDQPYVMDIDGRDIVMVKALNENSSKWYIDPKKNNFYRIENLKRTQDNKIYMSLEERDKNKKTNIHLGKWYDDDYESYWAFDKVGTEKYIIQNRYSGMCATISDGDSIKQLDFDKKNNDRVDKQTWLLVYPDKPTIKTKSLTAGKTGQAYKQTLTGTCDEWIEIEWKLASDSGKLPDGLSLSKDGTISGTPTKGGTFNIKVIAYNEFGETSKDYSLTIEGTSSIPVTEIVLNKISANLKIGGTETLTATVKPENADDKTIKWSSSDIKVASVDESGKVTAVGVGTAEIYATNEASKVKGTCKVTVTKTEEDKDTFTVTFTSDGKVYETQSVKNGETAVAPKSPTKAGHRFDGWYDSTYKNKFDFSTKITANTTLYAKWTNISGNIYTNDLTLVAGRKINIKEDCFPGLTTDVARYTISSSKLASQSKGMLKVKKAGSIEVIAQSSVNGGYEDVGVCSITILSKPKLKFTVPMTYQRQTMEAAGFFTTTDTISSQVTMWESSKPNVIRVANEKTGTLEAVGNGSAKITAYFGQKGVAGTVKVSATLKVKVPKFAKAEYTIKAGSKKVMPVKNVVAAQNPQFRIDNPAVATVEPQINKKGNPTGKAIVRGVSAGDATLTAIIDGREYTCTIHITGSK